MSLAIDEAWNYQLLTYPNPAVGAVIVSKNGELLAVSAHKQAGYAHAEVLAIRDAYVQLSGDRELIKCNDAHLLHFELIKRAGSLFSQATIYVTLEPCNHTGKTPSCANLIAALKFKRVVIGAMDPNSKAAGGVKRLKNAGIEVVQGVENRACNQLIEPFIKWQNGRFIFFKLAQTINGVIDGGIISCRYSREWVHKVRSRLDLLVIGGNTVRIDRPTLDSRLINAKAPNIAILTSHPDSFDPTIPLFQVPNRKVFFIDSIDKLPQRGLIMIEGGAGTLKTLLKLIDWMVLFISPSIKEGACYNVKKNFELLHQARMDCDTMLWLKVNHG